MDTSSGYPPNFIATAISVLKPSSENPPFPSAGLLGPSGLARYHSAPSSMLASLTEPDLFASSDGSDLDQYLAHVCNTKFASFGNGILSVKPSNKEQSSFPASQGHNQQDQIQNDTMGRQWRPYTATKTGSNCLREHVGQGPLSAILEHGGEGAVAFRPSQSSPREHRTMPGSSTSFDGLLPAKSHLIRHSSLPADLISRLVTDDMSERPFPHVEMATTLRGDDSTGGKVFLLTSPVSPRAVPIRKNYGEASSSGKADAGGTQMSNELKHDGFLRQSSSPAGLLAQLSLNELSGGSEMPDMFSRIGRSSMHELVYMSGVSSLDEDAMDAELQKVGAFGQRKRGRVGEAGLPKGLPTTDLLQMDSMDHGSCAPSYLHSAVMTGKDDSLLRDSVLCSTSRAKRGCATHPRSIAERVRRTKISDRIRKLQELVPNLDKQAHTADMLDEVVEYVKLLQRQVQELSSHTPECNGLCHRVDRKTLEL